MNPLRRHVVHSIRLLFVIPISIDLQQYLSVASLYYSAALPSPLCPLPSTYFGVGVGAECRALRYELNLYMIWVVREGYQIPGTRYQYDTSIIRYQNTRYRSILDLAFSIDSRLDLSDMCETVIQLKRHIQKICGLFGVCCRAVHRSSIVEDDGKYHKSKFIPYRHTCTTYSAVIEQ